MQQMNLRSTLLVAFTLALVPALYAQTSQDQSSAPHRQFRQHGRDAESETRMLTKRLNLTPDQAAAVEPILADQQQRMSALRPAAGSQPDFKAIREQRKAITVDTHEKLAAILTADQKQQLDTMHEHHGQDHGAHGNWAQKPGTAPSV